MRCIIRKDEREQARRAVREARERGDIRTAYIIMERLGGPCTKGK